MSIRSGSTNVSTALGPPLAFKQAVGALLYFAPPPPNLNEAHAVLSPWLVEGFETLHHL
ncbi:MAG: hypothetical protein QM533_13385 [Cytophagales bacterium]|nr:hypothetical protein [Cytophagales bacterium]